MEIENCPFPEDVLYDTDEDVWVRIDPEDVVTIGVTSVLSALAGKLLSVKLRPVGVELQRGRSLRTIESARFVGAVRTPITGTLLETNPAIALRPKLVNDSPYGEGWIAKIRPHSLKEELGYLGDVRSSVRAFRARIMDLRVRCFEAYPDHEMWEIAVECAAVIVRLNELMNTMAVGEVVHVVSDDPTADIEMMRWSDETGQNVIEFRKEGNLMHFIVRKIK